MKNKNLQPKYTLGVAVFSYLLKYIIGGAIGDVFGLLGFICLALAIVGFIETAVRKNKENK